MEMAIEPTKLAQPRCSIVIQSRRAILAVWAVDGVIFDDRAADNLSSQLQPDLYVKGDIYSIDILTSCTSDARSVFDTPRSARLRHASLRSSSALPRV